MSVKSAENHTKGTDASSPTCNVCKSRLIVRYPRVRDAITNEDFAVYKCIECGLGHTLPQPDNLERHYAEAYYGNRHGITNYLCLKRRTRLLLSILRKPRGRSLLDIGCGDASFLLEMKKLGWDVVGTEMNPSLEPPEGIIVKKDIAELSDYAGFDCVTMWHSLEHMRDMRSTLSKANSLLKPDGALIIAVPNNKSLQADIFGCNWFTLDVPRHLYHFDVSSLQHCLGMTGFIVDRQLYQELEYDLLGWAQSALNSIFNQPNIFFDILRRRGKKYGPLIGTLNWVLGFIFIALSIPAVIVERLFNRSGTIITVAHKSG